MGGRNYSVSGCGVWVKIFGRRKDAASAGQCCLGGETAPVGDLFQAFSAGVLEESNLVAGMFELVDVGPNFSLPGQVVRGSFSATGAAGMEHDALAGGSLDVLEFEENAADFFDFFVGTEDVFIAKQVSEAKFAGLEFGFLAGMERPIFGTQLLSRVASHPERIFVSHAYPIPGFSR